MKKSIFAFIALLILASSVIYARNESVLPVVKVYDQEFYVFKVSNNNTSLSAVSRTYEWNPDTLTQYNTGLEEDVEKGMLLYYPKQKSTANAENDAKGSTIKSNVKHEVKKGETINNIAMIYGVTPELIIEQNPVAAKGVAPGDDIYLTFEKQGLTYTVKPGENLNDIATLYDTNVLDIFKVNRRLTPWSLSSGDVIRVPRNTNEGLKREVVETINRIVGFTPYKVKKNDTWNAIALNNNVDVAVLMTVNEGVALKKNHYIAIPEVETFTGKKIVTDTDPRDETQEGRIEIYQELNGLSKDGKSLLLDPERPMKIAVVLENLAQKKSEQFMKGFALYMGDKVQNQNIKAGIVDLRGDMKFDFSKNDYTKDADVIFAVFDNDIPSSLVNFAEKSNAELVNVFNVKNDNYINKQKSLNMLTPTEYFNDAVVDEAIELFGEKDLIVVGKVDQNDILSKNLISSLSQNPIYLSKEDLENFAFNDGRDYLVFCMFTDKPSVEEVLDVIIESESNMYEGGRIDFLGRPNIATFAELLKEKLSSVNSFIPSRVYYDISNQDVIDFSDSFEEMYHSAPISTFPNYAAMGYDMAKWVDITLSYNLGDFNVSAPERVECLQMDINLEPVSNWSGLMNTASYILHFAPAYFDKIIVK